MHLSKYCRGWPTPAIARSTESGFGGTMHGDGAASSSAASATAVNFCFGIPKRAIVSPRSFGRWWPHFQRKVRSQSGYPTMSLCTYSTFALGIGLKAMGQLPLNPSGVILHPEAAGCCGRCLLRHEGRWPWPVGLVLYRERSHVRGVCAWDISPMRTAA